MAKIVSSNEFNEETKSGLVVVDFFADWCGPCKMLAPIFEELAPEYEGRAKFIKVDVDHSPDLAMKFRVASIPTIIILKDGEKVAGNVGFIPKEQIKSMIDSNL